MKRGRQVRGILLSADRRLEEVNLVLDPPVLLRPGTAERKAQAWQLPASGALRLLDDGTAYARLLADRLEPVALPGQEHFEVTPDQWTRAMEKRHTEVTEGGEADDKVTKLLRWNLVTTMLGAALAVAVVVVVVTQVPMKLPWS